ncbi:unnamed protein product, partial [marine sediment metagenome]
NKTVIDLREIDSIIEYEPEELLAVVSTGTRIDQLNAILEENNQFFPLNPPLTSRATIGGTIASNSYGFLMSRYGTALDMTLGLKFVRADGTLVKAGGRVAKNVAGYDITKLMIGSWGTLGIITQIAVRVHPKPEMIQTIIVGFDTLFSAIDSAFDVLDSHFAPDFLLILNSELAVKIMKKVKIDPGQADFFIIMGADGLPETVKWQENEIKNIYGKNRARFCDVISKRKNDQVRNELRDYVSSVYKGIILKVVSTRSAVQKI